MGGVAGGEESLDCYFYVAKLNGEWITLVCFSGAAPHLAGREEWIGWSAVQRARRLGFVVNNSRYLLLPDRHVYPNLGSKVLSLCLKRLSKDWEQVWKQPVLVVESFVDEHFGYEGTAYKACGFEAVKEHGRLTRWRIQRKTLSPEEAGLCGCRQFIAVWRKRHYLRRGRVYKKSRTTLIT